MPEIIKSPRLRIIVSILAGFVATAALFANLSAAAPPPDPAPIVLAQLAPAHAVTVLASAAVADAVAPASSATEPAANVGVVDVAVPGTAGSVPVVVVERPSLPDPLNEPLSFWDGVKDLRRTGGFWAALALGAAALLAAGRARAVPRPGEPEPDPASWRARSIALFAGLAAVLGAGGDMLLGLGNWAALFTTVVASASLIWRAFNPVRGSAPAKPVSSV